ncbi:MAG TPA: histidine phosphatase family protein [Trebonia sp.]|jgi:probable phosphoglycerate mutase|nr:histidine phosphatase family protein [Trebonia sp.]
MSTRPPNTFYVMRHGQSKANEQGIIVSHVATDQSGDYGLSELGRQQARDAASRSGLGSGTLIYSSDFARARQTAQIVRAQLTAPPITLVPALRERFFGDWEGTSIANYAAVWATDELDPGHQDHNVEPVTAVLARAVALVASLDKEHAGRDILLVSHGDTLQILQAGLAGIDPAGHRSLPHLGTAEIRQLARAS